MMRMKLKDGDEFPTFCAGCAIGEIEINPNLPSIKITPNQGRRVLLTGDAARLLISFMCLIADGTESLEGIKEHTDEVDFDED